MPTAPSPTVWSVGLKRLMSVTHLLAMNSEPDERQIRKGIAGNVCRCTGYQNIMAAIKAAAGTKRG